MANKLHGLLVLSTGARDTDEKHELEFEKGWQAVQVQEEFARIISGMVVAGKAFTAAGKKLSDKRFPEVKLTGTITEGGKPFNSLSLTYSDCPEEVLAALKEEVKKALAACAGLKK